MTKELTEEVDELLKKFETSSELYELEELVSSRRQLKAMEEREETRLFRETCRKNREAIVKQYGIPSAVL